MSQLSFTGRYYRFFPQDKLLGQKEHILNLDMNNTALLAVDIGGMGHGYLEKMESKVMSESIIPSITAARTCGIPIIYVNNSAPKIAITHSELAKICKRSFDLDWEEWGSENTVDPREYVYGNSNALEIPAEATPQPQDYFLRKHAYSGFFETRLDSLLRNLAVKSLVCVGFSLDVCLGSTMVDAMNLNYQVVLLRDATLAQELPEDLEALSFTKRLITLTEYSIGFTAASNDFVTACDDLHNSLTTKTKAS